MTFTPIDMETWHRKPYFLHYHKDIPCTYSMTVSLDITPIRQRAVKLYPAMLYCLARAVKYRALAWSTSSCMVISSHSTWHPGS